MNPTPSDAAYAVRELLPCDGRAVLYRAVRLADAHPVMLKVLDPQCSRPRDLEQLKHEYELGKLVDSAAVLRPLALQTHEGMPALVMEDFGATSLDRLIDGPMPVESFLVLASRIAAAVEELHRKDVVHRNLKPSNILVGPSGEVKLADLAMAARLARGCSGLHSPSRIEGSLPYMSPEQTGRMNRSVDSRSDLYALGVTFYEMLTGRLPFEASDPLSWVHCHVARTPRPPGELVSAIPPIVSDIVLKLLAKLAEDRYQTARGLQHDLDVCLSAWKEATELTSFPLGQRDVSDRFEIAEKLYGREEENLALSRAFERVVASGTPELVLVSGDPGIGKSSLIRELHRPVARARGLFVAGKVEQYRRDVPYAAFAQAFSAQIEQLLTESEERLATWRADLKEALGDSGQLIVDIIPQLGLIVGPQSPVVPLPPLEARNRLHTVFRKFVGVFARKEHPLALFIDDLQWLDFGSLELIEDLVVHPETGYLLLLGAYRDSEVGPSHALRLTLGDIRKAIASVLEIVPRPLRVESIAQLISDVLHCGPERAEPLACLVHEKTAGIPFFAIQFLSTLHREGLLEFDDAASEWRWDVMRIQEKGFTENVLDLMARKLNRLPAATRDALKLAACVGRSTDLRTLSVISGKSEEQTAQDLWDAVSEGLVTETGDVYAFVHDRVQQAAYALLGDREKSEVHLELGRIFLRELGEKEIAESVFDVVSQLNYGIDRIVDPAERDEVARLDLMAGRKAKASIAYASATRFLAAAAAVLPDDAWSSRYELVFAVFLERAECEFLCGEFEQAEALFEVLVTRARTVFDKAAVYELRLKLCHVSGKYDQAVVLGLAALRLFGVEFPDDDDAIDRATRAEVGAVEAALGARRIADLANAPEATDPSARAIIGLLSNVSPGVYLGRRSKLFPLVVLKLVRYSLEYGPTYESCVGYSAYSVMLVSLFGDPRSAYAFSEMSIELNRKLGDVRRRGTVLHMHGGHVHFWFHPIATALPILESGFFACVESGDLGFANDITFEIVWQAFETGDTVDDVLERSKKYAVFARDSRNEAVYQTVRVEQQLLACLKGATRGPSRFDDEAFDEDNCLSTLGRSAFMCGVFFFHVAKLIAAYLASDDALAVHHANEAKKTLSAAMAMPIEATFYYFDALLLARIHRDKGEAEQRAILETLEAYSKKLVFWASHSPENFLTKHALVAAEIARIKGDPLEAERRYEDAIQSARANGFVHWQAIANEHAGRFHAGRGLPTIADAYLREALSCYRRWGAEAKAVALERENPKLRGVTRSRSSPTFVARTEQLDLLSVVKASQTISGVMVQDQLCRTLLELVLEEGGARRASLVLSRDGELTVAAGAAVEPPAAVEQAEAADAEELGRRVPLSVLHYVLRTRQRVVLDDAAIAGRFARDPYFARVRPRSALCVPIRRRAEVGALLYLENDLVPGAFTVERLLALELLATQAAISLENALLLERERAGRASAEAASRRALLLAEGTSLMSSTLDYERVFGALAHVCVRSFADWAVIDLLMDGKTVRLAGAHRDPAKASLLRELAEHYPADVAASAPAASILRGGGPAHLSALTDEQIRSTTVDARHAELVRQLGTRSVIVVPLVARDTRLGALTLASSSDDGFGPADVELAVELARRAALAMDNARLLSDTQNALRLREEFLSLASHELRTPLTSLRLSAEALIDISASGKTFPSETLASCLRRIVRETERLEALGAELTDVILIERGDFSIRRVDFDLVVLAREVVKRLESASRSACSPVTVTGDATVFGQWDRARIDKVIAHLLSNAVKFGAGRPIEIHVSNVDGVARLVVEDHGIGIEQATLSRMFERFERGVPIKHYGGLGLGLFVTRWIVQAHGGTIGVESSPGRGAKFSVELPCTAQASRNGTH